MNNALLALLSATGPIAIAVMLVIIGLFSQRLGAVTKTPSYYRWFFVAAVFVSMSIGARLLGATDAGVSEVVAGIYVVGLALGLTIGLITAWHYWRWLFSEREQR